MWYSFTTKQQKDSSLRKRKMEFQKNIVKNITEKCILSFFNVASWSSSRDQSILNFLNQDTQTGSCLEAKKIL